MNSSILSYAVSRFLDESGKTRFIVTNRGTGSPSICLSLFEHDQIISAKSPNSISKSLFELVYFYTWAESSRLNLDTILLNGTGISDIQIRQFSHWLRSYKTKRRSSLTPKAFNSIIAQCARFCVWCGKWEANRPSGRNSAIINQTADLVIRSGWRSKSIRVRISKAAPDLTDEEIYLIEKHLRPNAAIARGISPEVAYRNYLIWHLAIEMGLRISEILALRLQDCPQFNKNYISVVRIDERGDAYSDPRGVYAPRPKTLSRDLGFIIADSPLPRLLQAYISKYRYRKMQGGGKQFLLDHNFLVVTHETGDPLSIVSAISIAKATAMQSGVPNFHWHIARHAFFNRAYAAVAENDAYFNDLVYFGGWSDAKSLNIYIQRAIRNRATQTLSIWQQGNKWESLTK